MQPVSPGVPAPVTTAPSVVKETGITESAQAGTLAGTVTATPGNSLFAAVETNVVIGAAAPTLVGAEWGLNQGGGLGSNTPLPAHTIHLGNDVLVVVALQGVNPNHPTQPVTDSLGNTYNFIGRVEAQSPGYGTGWLGVYRATVTTGGSAVISIHLNGPNAQVTLGASAWEFSGLGTATLYDRFGVLSGATTFPGPFGAYAYTTDLDQTGGDLVLGAVCVTCPPGQSQAGTAFSAQAFTPSTSPTIGTFWADNSTLFLQTAWEVAATATASTHRFFLTATGVAAENVEACALVVSLSPQNAAVATVTGISDAGGNAWTRIDAATTAQYFGPTAQDFEIWTCPVSASPGPVTIALSGSCTAAATVLEVAHEGALQATSGVATGITTAPMTPSLGNANPTDLVLAFIGQGLNATFSAPTAGYTAQTQRTSTGGSAPATVQAASFAPSSPGSNSFGLTSTSALPWASAIIALSGVTVAGVISWPLTNPTDQGFQPDGVGFSALTLQNAASAANGLVLQGQAAGNGGVTLAPGGADTDQGLTILAKGAGRTTIQGGGLSIAGGLVVTGGGGSVSGGLTVTGAISATTTVTATTSMSAPQFTATGAGALVLAPTGNQTVSITGGAAASPGPALVIAGVSSGVNWLTVTNAVTTAAVVVGSAGADTNVDVNVVPKGTGTLRLNGTAVMTNVMTTLGDLILGGAAGAATRLAIGSSGQVLTVTGGGTAAWGTISGGIVWPLAYTGDETFQPNSIANSALDLANAASAGNGIKVTGNAAGTAPTVAVISSGANEDLHIDAKGTGQIKMAGTVTTTVTFGGSIQVSTAVKSSGTLQLQGNSATSNVSIQNGSNTNFQFVGVSSANNFLQSTNAANGSPPILAAIGGSDTNVDIQVLPKGTGVVDLHYATIAVGGGASATLGTIGGSGPTAAAQNCWVAIKANGTTTFLPGWR